jgi:transcriptional regulator with XRE-family HTH domain
MTDGGGSLRIEEGIGQRIRERREQLEMSQAELGRLLGPLLDKEWSRQTVSAAEQGKRAFTSAEVVAISHVLRTTVSQLFRPPAKAGEITMPSGATFPAHMVFAGEGAPRDDWNMADIDETIDHLEASAVQSRNLVQELRALVTQRVAGGSGPRLPHYESGLSPTALKPGQDDGSPSADAESRDDHGTGPL